MPDVSLGGRDTHPTTIRQLLIGAATDIATAYEALPEGTPCDGLIRAGLKIARAIDALNATQYLEVLSSCHRTRLVPDPVLGEPHTTPKPA